MESPRERSLAPAVAGPERLVVESRRVVAESGQAACVAGAEPRRAAPTHDAGACWRTLPDGVRRHARHGPIDLIVEVDAAPEVRARSEAAARDAFAPLLATLVAELPELRRPLGARPHRLRGPVARRMLDAVGPYRDAALTPMAAVAGAVADHVLASMRGAEALRRAYVNNGGDIALYLAPGESFRVALCGDPASGERSAEIDVRAGSAIGGIATSGWRGRSHSLGIADAVTVLARTAAAADAAATLIANAVELPGSPLVRRAPARELAPDSDLGERLVTLDVAPLPPGARERALDAGAACARRCLARGLVLGVRLELQSSARVVGGRALAGGRAWRL